METRSRFLSLLSLLFSRMFFHPYKRINCRGWGRGFRPLCLNSFCFPTCLFFVPYESINYRGYGTGFRPLRLDPFFFHFVCSSSPMRASIAGLGYGVSPSVPRSLFLPSCLFFVPYERINSRVGVRGFALCASIPFSSILSVLRPL